MSIYQCRLSVASTVYETDAQSKGEKHSFQY